VLIYQPSNQAQTSGIIAYYHCDIDFQFKLIIASFSLLRKHVIIAVVIVSCGCLRFTARVILLISVFHKLPLRGNSWSTRDFKIFKVSSCYHNSHNPMNRCQRLFHLRRGRLLFTEGPSPDPNAPPLLHRKYLQFAPLLLPLGVSRTSVARPPLRHGWSCAAIAPPLPHAPSVIVLVP